MAPIICPEQQGREKPALLSPEPLHAVASPGNAFQEQTTAQELSVSRRENILQISNSPFSCEALEVSHSSNPIAQIWKYLLVQVVLVLPFPRNPFAAPMYIQTRDCGIACENSYSLCNNHKEKRRGRFERFERIRKIFSNREERIFLFGEKERALSLKQLSLLKSSSSGRGGGVGNVPSWSPIPLEASLDLRSTRVEISLEFLNFPSGKGRAKNTARKKEFFIFFLRRAQLATCSQEVGTAADSFCSVIPNRLRARPKLDQISWVHCNVFWLLNIEKNIKTLHDKNNYVVLKWASIQRVLLSQKSRWLVLSALSMLALYNSSLGV